MNTDSFICETGTEHLCKLQINISLQSVYDKYLKHSNLGVRDIKQG